MTDEELVAAFNSYCKKALWHKCQDIKRRQQRLNERELLLKNMDDNVIINHLVESHDVYPSDLLWIEVGGERYAFHSEVLQEALVQLREPEQRLILLKWWDGCSDDEIGMQMGLSRHTVCVKRNRTLERLKALLNEGEPR